MGKGIKYSPCKNCGCGTPTYSPIIYVGGKDVCDMTFNTPSFQSVISDRKIFLGEIKTSVGYEGKNYSTGSTSIHCMGAGSYTFTVTSTNPNVIITPSSITVVMNDKCHEVSRSKPSYFTLHYDYYDPPNQKDVGFNEIAIICNECVCPGLGDSVQFNCSGQFLEVVGVPECPSPPGGYGSYFNFDPGFYQTKTLKFQKVSGLALEFINMGYLGYGLGFTAPSWGYYSDDFSLPDNGVRDCPGRCGSSYGATTYKGKYILGCGAGLNVYLLIKTVRDYNYYDVNDNKCKVEVQTSYSVGVVANFLYSYTKNDSCNPLYLIGDLSGFYLDNPPPGQVNSVILTS